MVPRKEDGLVSIMDLDMPKPSRPENLCSTQAILRISSLIQHQTKCWLSQRITLHCWNTEDHEGKSPGLAYRFATDTITRLDSNKWDCGAKSTVC
jgi:hypothetical protein